MTDLIPAPLIVCQWCGQSAPGELHHDPYRFEALCRCGRLIVDEPVGEEAREVDLELPAWLEPAGDVVAFPGVTVAEAIDNLQAFARWAAYGVRVLPADTDVELRARGHALEYLDMVEASSRRLDTPVLAGALDPDVIAAAFGHDVLEGIRPRLEQVRRKVL